MTTSMNTIRSLGSLRLKTPTVVRFMQNALERIFSIDIPQEKVADELQHKKKTKHHSSRVLLEGYSSVLNTLINLRLLEDCEWALDMLLIRILELLRHPSPQIGQRYRARAIGTLAKMLCKQGAYEG